MLLLVLTAADVSLSEGTIAAGRQILLTASGIRLNGKEWIGKRGRGWDWMMWMRVG